MAGFLDFLGSGGGGGLLDFLRNNAMNQQFVSGRPEDQAQYGDAPLQSNPMDAMARMRTTQAQPLPLPLPELPARQPAPPAQQQPMAPQPPQQDFGGNALTGLQSFLNGGGLISSIRAASNGQRSDPVGIALQNQNAQFRAFQQAGLTPSQAMIAISNPKLAENLMARLTPEYSAHNIGNTAGAFNKNTGEFKPAYTDTKYEKLGPGENLVAVGGPGGKANTIASGGPEKPAAGYQWADPSDPGKGLVAIPGGPGTHLPSETAGRIAMMDTAAAELPKAREVLMKDRTKTGTSITNMIGSTIDAGEYSRANRTVRLAIEGALRAMTGANAPEKEVDRYEGLFMPGRFDARETAAQKLNQLDDFISNAKRLVTQGRGPAGNAPATRASDPLGIR